MYGFVALWLVVSWWALWPCGLLRPCSPVVGCGAVALWLVVAAWLRGWPWLVAWGVGYSFVAHGWHGFVGCCCGLVACCWLWSVAGQLALVLWPVGGYCLVAMFRYSMDLCHCTWLWLCSLWFAVALLPW